MIFAMLSLVIPLVLGAALVRLVWPLEWANWSALIIQGCLAVLVGAGAASCLGFVWLLLWNSWAGYPVFEAMLAVGLLVLALARRNWRLPRLASPVAGGTPVERWVWLVGLAVCLIGIAALLAVAYGAPYGAYDAWAIWNIHARFLFRSGEHWRDLFLPASSAHPDYPLLVPALVARSWSYAGAEVLLVPAAWSVLFTLASVGLLFATLALLRGRTVAWLAGAALLASHFVYNGAAQMSDVPLSAYILATVALLCLHDGGQPQPRALVLAGACLGLAAWTKNEGLLFVVVTALAGGLACLWLRRRSALWLYALRLALGAVLPLLVVAFFKLALAPANDLVSGQRDAGLLGLLLAPERYLQIGRTYLRWFATFGRGSLVVLGLYLALSWRRLRFPDTVGALAGLLIVVFMLAGYFLVYLTTPHDLTWHLASFERLLLHLWPTVVLVAFLQSGDPLVAALASPRSAAVAPAQG